MTEPVRLPRTESHLLRSDITGTEFEISIGLPWAETTERLPVVFTLDANTQFGFMTDLATTLSLSNEIPPVVIVGIGYPTGTDIGALMERRAQDMIEATSDGSHPYTGAPDFLRFITDELWPWLEARYSVSDDRTLRGHSYGGCFCLYALFHHPGFFLRYVIGSPEDAGDVQRFHQYEARFAETHNDLDAVVYLAHGQQGEDAHYWRNTQWLGDALAARAYPNLRLKTVLLPDDTHLTAAFTIAALGLKWVFDQT